MAAAVKNRTGRIPSGERPATTFLNVGPTPTGGKPTSSVAHRSGGTGALQADHAFLDHGHRKALLSKRHSYKRRPITEPALMQSVLDAARRLSPEHWEVVMILYMTGIEVRALSKVTWRDYMGGWLLWKRPKRNETLKIPLHDRELERAVRGYTSRPRKTPDKIDRMVREVRKEAGLDQIPDFSPMTLRVTRAWLMLQEGLTAEAVSRYLSLSPAVVREVGAFPSAVHEAPPPALTSALELAGE